METPILFVDFDRTLFDSTRFSEAIGQVLQKLYGINQEEFIAKQSDFFTYHDEHYDYDFYAHAHDMTGETPERIRAILKTELGSASFLFDDYKELRKWQRAGYTVRILTFGNEAFQRLKLEYAKAISDVPGDIIQEQKRDFIAREHPDGHGWLVDDKPDQKLPKGFVEITLDRKAQLPKAIQTEYGGIVSNLTQVQDLL